MNLQDVDVGAQSFHAGFNSVEDVLSTQADLIDHLPIVGTHGAHARLRIVCCHSEIAFREDDKLAARDIVLLDGFGDDFFREAIRVCICCLRYFRVRLAATSNISVYEHPKS